MRHDKFHLACCYLPLGGIILWLASAASLVMAWLAGGGFFWERPAVEWYWDALVLGVLAIGLKVGVLIRQNQWMTCGSDCDCEKSSGEDEEDGSGCGCKKGGSCNC